MNEWLAPGLVELIDRIESALTSDNDVVVRVPALFPHGLEAQIKTLLRKIALTQVRFRPSDGSIARQILASHDPGHRALESSVEAISLMDIPTFEQRIFCPRLSDRAQAQAWLKFIDESALLRRAHPDKPMPRICLLLEGGALGVDAKRKVGVEVMDADAGVSFMDVLLVALSLARNTYGTGVKAQIVGQTCANLALWDFELVKRLVGESHDTLQSPQDFLKAYALEQQWTPGMLPSWANGAAKTCDSTQRLHSATLALQANKKEIASRVWAGQASVLLPIIELRRKEVIDEYRTLLRTHLPFTPLSGTPVTDPDDLEIGEIEFLLSRSRVSVNRLSGIKHARNELAHLRSLPLSKALAGEIVNRFVK